MGENGGVMSSLDLSLLTCPQCLWRNIIRKKYGRIYKHAGKNYEQDWLYKVYLNCGEKVKTLYTRDEKPTHSRIDYSHYLSMIQMTAFLIRTVIEMTFCRVDACQAPITVVLT